jgi:cytochrome c oxidase cbb3-type subunit III
VSDFISNGWAIFITIVTVLGILGVFWFLTAQSSHKVRKGQHESDDTGHVWDGDLRELNNPMPRWWLGMFYSGIIFGVIYLALYPGLGDFKGLKSYSTIKEYEEERAKADEAAKPIYAAYMKLDIPHVAADPKVREMGQRLFLNYCSQCHGSDAGGAKGFPNLSDKDWLYGGEPETIRTTITKGRNGVMPALGEAIGGEENVRDVAHYVRSLSGLNADAERVKRGQKIFSGVCAACHGADAKGNKVMGAPNLSDGIWLYGSSEKTIMETIMHGRNNIMPAHEEKLSPEKIQLLAAYVWSLSNTATK